MKRIAAVLASVVVLMGLSATAAQAAEPVAKKKPNTYTVLGLPEYLTYPTRFTVQVNGRNAVCSMQFGSTVVNEGPWWFEVDSSDLPESTDILVNLCNGKKQWINTVITVPYTLSKTRLMAETGSDTVTVTNNTDMDAIAVAKVGQAGTDIGSVTIPPHDSAVLNANLSGIGKDNVWVEVANGDGVHMTFPMPVGQGWSILGGGATFQPCSTLTWSYDASAQPGDASTMKADVVTALDLLHQQTGLMFTETGDPNASDIDFYWGDISEYGGNAAGLGSTAGWVEFSNTNFWPKDDNAGFGAGGRAASGRGWLVVHEVMHVLGFGHVNDTGSLMSPVNLGQQSFNDGDLEGLHTLYPTANCPV